MKRKILLLLRNPLVIVPPFVVLLGIGWQHYTYAGRNLSLPTPSLNLLPNSNFATLNAQGIPTGWQLTKHGAITYTASSTRGYTGSAALKLAVTRYQNGDISLTSPKVTVKPAKTYLFKAYYNASMQFAVVARSYHTDGSSDLQSVGAYPSTGSNWSTTSYAFQSTPDVVAVQLVYRLYHKGTFQLNSPYAEPRQNAYTPSAITGTNVIPNSQLTAAEYDVPQNWLTYHAGANTAVFTYQPAAQGTFVETQVSSYRDGQAKWQYMPTPVKPNQYFQISLQYRSNTPVSLVAEYTLENNTHDDQTIAQLPPADDWTTAVYQFQTFPKATSMFVSLPLQHAGTVASRNYQLIDITKSNAAQWQEPLVSITFDDGLQLAYHNATSVLKTYGYKATYYINPASIETPNFMSAAELTTLSNQGNEIGAHGYEHGDLTTINDNALNYQLQEGRDYLQSAGFRVTDFAPPYGRTDAEVQAYARRYFATLRGTDTGINTLQNLDPYNLRVLPITSQTSAADLATALKLAKAYNGWLILAYHQVSQSKSGHSIPHVENASVSLDAFKSQMQAIHDSAIRVLPVHAAYQALTKP